MPRIRRQMKPCFCQIRGFWTAVWYLRDGRRRSMQIRKAKTKEEAETLFRKKYGPAPEPLPPRIGTIKPVFSAFERQVCVYLKPATRAIYQQVWTLLQTAKIIDLEDITTEKMQGVLEALIASGSGPTNQHKLLRHVRRFFRWSKLSGYITNEPTVEMPKVRRKSKGRPLTGEEFERMLAATDVVYAKHPERGEECKRALRGMWESGLRIGEMNVSWDDEFSFHIDWKNHKRPVFVLPDQYDKTGQDRIFPMTPEFWMLIAETPPDERHGPVFHVPPPLKNRHTTRFADSASKIIAQIGKKANVVVAKTREGVKYASAHDLRRSFGLRWSQKVNQMQLMALMRHSDPKVTATYYLGANAALMLESIWDV